MKIKTILRLMALILMLSFVHGMESWSIAYGGADYDAGSSIIPTTDGGFVFVAARFSNNDANWNLIS